MSKNGDEVVPAWREFEQLVSRIEKAAAPRDAIVTSPDNLPDLDTGTMREVDASIRYTIGTVPVLITIECRKRKDAQDITWVEQLAAKRENLGASKTIAVAAKGFSKEAIAKANRAGVELRKIDRIGPHDIDTWLTPQSIFEVMPRAKLLRPPEIQYIVESTEDEGAFSALQKSEEDQVKTKQFETVTGERLSLAEIWRRTSIQNRVYDNVPMPNGRMNAEVAIEAGKGELKLHTPIGPREVRKIVLAMELSYEVAERPVLGTTLHRYSEPDGIEIDRAEFDVALSNIDMRLAIQTDPDTGGALLEGGAKFREKSGE